jgi:cytochrome d ubiquinol oxidase subunit II
VLHLSDIWFIAIAVLWAGYFVLEGFDFGVGILLPVLGRTSTQRRAMINTIGPVWDGNEVWLLTAGGATFAAFPGWYASMFSAFYLPLLLVLVCLIFRGVAFEYRGKRDSDRWRLGWDTAIFGGSLIPALLWGVAFGNVLHGIPLNAAHNYTGNFFSLLNPYSLLGGVTTLTLFTLNGALFLGLKTTDDLRRRANALAWKIGLVTIVAGAGFLAWTEASYRSPGHVASGVVSVLFAAVAAVTLIGGVLASRLGREGYAFAAVAAAIVTATGALFTALFPDVLRSSVSPAAFTLTVGNASSTAKTLALMTVIACIFLPFVLLYQGWTYWVFRKRISVPGSSAAAPPEVPPAASGPFGGAARLLAPGDVPPPPDPEKPAPTPAAR